MAPAGAAGPGAPGWDWTDYDLHGWVAEKATEETGRRATTIITVTVNITGINRSCGRFACDVGIGVTVVVVTVVILTIVVVVVIISIVVLTIAVTIVIVAVRELDDGVDRRGAPLATGGGTVDADVGSGCGRRGCARWCGLTEAHPYGEVHEFLLVSTTMFFEGSLGFRGGCLPSCSTLHSPSPGRVP